MRYFFISVNYNSHYLIKKWANSIYRFIPEATLIIVDNFSTQKERECVLRLSKEINFILIESENLGYSAGLNKGLEKVLSFIDESIIFCGNLDIEFLNIPNNFISGQYVYVPIVTEKRRKNRNPFLTKFQKKLIPIYSFAARTKSPLFYFIAIMVNKIAGYFKSEIWAIHGSLFCFHSSLLKGAQYFPFNDFSFLYGEEYEFASFVEKVNAEYLYSQIKIFHEAHETTSKFVKSNYINIWAESFLNYLNRQKLY